MAIKDNTPVLVGCGQITRIDNPEGSLKTLLTL